MVAAANNFHKATQDLCLRLRNDIFVTIVLHTTSNKVYIYLFLFFSKSVTFRSLVKQTTTRNLYITIYIYFLDGRLCEVGAVRRGIRIVRRWGLNFSMSGDDGRDNAYSVTTREVSWTAGSFSSELPSVQFVGLILPSNSHADIRTRLYASAILPISGDWDVSLPLPLEWPAWSSSSGNNYQ